MSLPEGSWFSHHVHWTEDGVWENVDPFVMAKKVGGFYLWSLADETRILEDVRWGIDDKSGTLMEGVVPTIQTPLSMDVWERIAAGQAYADAAYKEVWHLLDRQTGEKP